MLLDRNILEIFLKNMKFSKIQRDTIITQYGSDLQDLILEFMLNKLSSEMSDEEIAKFENTMKRAAHQGNADSQREILIRIKEILKEKPEIGVELNKFLNKVDREFFFSLMSNADANGQTQALEYLYKALSSHSKTKS
jgi:aspartyl-tRNA synthetase